MYYGRSDTTARYPRGGWPRPGRQALQPREPGHARRQPRPLRAPAHPPALAAAGDRRPHAEGDTARARPDLAQKGIGRIRVADWLLAEIRRCRARQGSRRNRRPSPHVRDADERHPNQGVVDGDCRVHGIGNLYIGGSSAFATTG